VTTHLHLVILVDPLVTEKLICGGNVSSLLLSVALTLTLCLPVVGLVARGVAFGAVDLGSPWRWVLSVSLSRVVRKPE